jgi:hypothetical protein
MEQDLSKEDPSPAAAVTVHRHAESSDFGLAIHLWKLARIDVRYHVRGPVSWAAPLCAVVVAEGILAALMTRLLLSPATPDGTRIAVGAAFGGVALATGIGVPLYLLRRTLGGADQRNTARQER